MTSKIKVLLEAIDSIKNEMVVIAHASDMPAFDRVDQLDQLQVLLRHAQNNCLEALKEELIKLEGAA